MQDLKQRFKIDFQAQLKDVRRKLNCCGSPAEACVASPYRMPMKNASCGKNPLKTLTIVRLSLCVVGIVVGQSVFAGSIQEPGETTGLALGSPLPQGVYFINPLNYGVRQGNPRVGTTVEIPILAWSTPWTIAGGRLLLGFSTPAVNVDVHGGSSFGDLYYPEIIYGFGWRITPQLSASFFGATYFPVNNKLTDALIGDRGTNRFGGAVTYTNDDWTFSAYTQYGIPYGSDVSVPDGDHQWFNLDLTAMKSLGKWQLGIVAYGSTDTTSPYNGYKRQSQMAAGPLVGYDFGLFTLQAKATTEFYEANYGGRDSRVWTTLIVPLRF